MPFNNLHSACLRSFFSIRVQYEMQREWQQKVDRQTKIYDSVCMYFVVCVCVFRQRMQEAAVVPREASRHLQGPQSSSHAERHCYVYVLILDMCPQICVLLYIYTCSHTRYVSSNMCPAIYAFSYWTYRYVSSYVKHRVICKGLKVARMQTGRGLVCMRP